MTVLDVVILAAIAACALYGARAGLIRELSHIMAFAAGIFLAAKLHSTAAAMLLYRLPSSTASVAAFLGLLLLVIAAVYLAFSYIKSSADKLKLGPADHVVGAAFGAIQGSLISALIIFALVNFSSALPASYLKRSRVASFLLDRSAAVSGMIPKGYISKVVYFFSRKQQPAQDSPGSTRGAANQKIEAPRRHAAPESGDNSAKTKSTGLPASNTLAGRIKPPPGFSRVPVEPGSFGEWLRNLALKPGCPPVCLYNGQGKQNQGAHCAVVDMDIGRKNLQQCADALIRLRAEYLYSKKRFDKIHFNFTSGHRADFARWAEGFRPVVSGSSVTWKKQDRPDSSYKSFSRYLETVFIYAGTASLEKELEAIAVSDMQIGDVFICGGFPGHAAIVADMAENTNGYKVFILAQSYMPAQDIHILRNPRNTALSPWYSLEFADKLATPEWEFSRSELRRFK